MITIKLNRTLKASEGELSLAIDMTIEKGDFAVLYGPSGAGKTSILRMIAGLMHPDAGEIKLTDSYWYSSQQKININTQKRKVGFLFQDYALFPNMTVKQNLSYALPKNMDATLVDEMLDLIEMAGLANASVNNLSGGQKQRVALARALVQQPELLLLDEPLSALDQEMRAKLQDFLQHIHKQFDLTILLVTHNLAETFKLANKVHVLENGQIVQTGPPDQVLIDHKMSAKFKFTGEILAITKQDVVYVITVLVGLDVVKVVAQQRDIQNLTVGDRVMLASKAFNPIIQKI